MKYGLVKEQQVVGRVPWETLRSWYWELGKHGCRSQKKVCFYKIVFKGLQEDKIAIGSCKRRRKGTKK